MQVQGNYQIISSFDRSRQVAGVAGKCTAGLVRSWASDLRRYACGGDGGDGGVALGGLPGGAWVVALSHKNHDLHLYIRCCDLVLMEIPRHLSH